MNKRNQFFLVLLCMVAGFLGGCISNLYYNNSLKNVSQEKIISKKYVTETQQEQGEDEIEYNYVGYFHEGLAKANLKPLGKYGYINKDGKVVIEFQFDNASGFSEGLAAVEIDGKYGYINPKGEVVIQFKWDYAGDFFDGKAEVRDNYHHYIIDTRGNILEETN